MVFKEQYPNLVSAARGAHRPVSWIVCLGWDVNDRVRALSEAIDKKRIKLDHAFDLLGPVQQDELLRALPAPERKLLSGDAPGDFAEELAAIRRRFGNWPTVERESSDAGLTVIHDLKNAMPELAAPAPRRVEQTDEERAEHAKRVREQAARFKEYAAKRASAAQPIPLTQAVAAEPETDAEQETIQ
jgi:hypothetical protein